jgi:hypothetical protein
VPPSRAVLRRRPLLALAALAAVAAACVGGEPPAPPTLDDSDTPTADGTAAGAVPIPSFPIRLVGDIDTVSDGIDDNRDLFRLPLVVADIVLSIDASNCTDDNATFAPFIQVRNADATITPGDTIACTNEGTVTVPPGEWFIEVAWGGVPGENTASYQVDVRIASV